METYQEEPNQPTHGYDGPLKVSYGGMYTNVGKQFLDTALAYDKERGPIDDVNGLYKCDGYGVSRHIAPDRVHCELDINV